MSIVNAKTKFYVFCEGMRYLTEKETPEFAALDALQHMQKYAAVSNEWADFHSNSIIYVDRRGWRIEDAQYTFEANQFEGEFLYE